MFIIILSNGKTFEMFHHAFFLKNRLRHRHFAENVSGFTQEKIVFMRNCILYFELVLSDCNNHLILL